MFLANLEIQISRLVLILLAVVLYIFGSVLRTKNKRKNAYYFELLGMILLVVYQFMGTDFSFNWSDSRAIILGISNLLFLLMLIIILVSKLFFRRK